MSDSFELMELDRITVGTVGVPGQRMFFLQARQDDQVVTLKMEKVQVAALAAWVAKTLEDEGVASFAKSFDELMQSLTDKANTLAAGS